MIQVKTLYHYWKSIIVIVTILYLSFAPSSTFKSIPTFENEDKLVHILMYFGLAAVLIFDYKKVSRTSKISTIAFVLSCLLFPVLLGGTIEILQAFFFNRSASWLDWLADTLGVLAGWSVMLLMNKKLFPQKN